MSLNSFKINKGITLGGQAAAPSSPVNGEMYFDNTSGFQFRQSGAWSSLGGGGGSGDITSTSVVTGTTQTIAVATRYVGNNAGSITYTLPATAAVGTVFQIVGNFGGGGWSVSQNASQYIIDGTQTTPIGTSGILASTNTNDCIEVVCIVANTGFQVRNKIGSLTASVAFTGSTYGYFIGGENAAFTPYTSIVKLTFSGETNALLAATMASNRTLSANGHSSSKGFALGGFVAGVAGNSIVAVTFSSDAVATLGATLATTKSAPSGVTSATKVYSLCGDSTGSPSNVVYSLVFVGETTANVTTFTVSRAFLASGSNITTAGYAAQGYNGGALNSISKLLYSTETPSALGSTMSISTYSLISYSSDTAFYGAGGVTGTGISKFTFSSETSATITGTYTPGGASGPGSGTSSTTKSYSTGNDSSVVSTIYTLVFSSETAGTATNSFATTRGASAGNVQI